MTRIARAFVLFAAMTGCATPVCAVQGIRLGLKAGVSMSHLHSDTAGYGSSDSATGIVVGPFAEMGLSQAVSIQPALVFARRGGTFRDLPSSLTGSLDTVDELDIRRDYLEAQALFCYNGPWRDRLPLTLIAGPAVGWILDYEVVEDGVGIDQRSGEDGSTIPRPAGGHDLALVVGAGFCPSIWGRRCTLDLLYRVASEGSHGDAAGADFKADGATVTLGMRF